MGVRLCGRSPHAVWLEREWLTRRDDWQGVAAVMLVTVVMCEAASGTCHGDADDVLGPCT